MKKDKAYLLKNPADFAAMLAADKKISGDDPEEYPCIAVPYHGACGWESYEGIAYLYAQDIARFLTKALASFLVPNPAECPRCEKVGDVSDDHHYCQSCRESF